MSVVPASHHPRVTRAEIVSVLRICGVSEGDTIVVHSALRPFGEVEGGAQTVAEGLLDTVGSDGTLVAPAFTFRHEAEADPIIDPRNDPSEMGVVSEAIRQLPGARRSTAYRHSFSAVGPFSCTLTDTDHSLSVFDMLSTFGRLLALDAKIVLLGLTYVSCTSFHFGEYLVQIPDRVVVDRLVRLRLDDGEVVTTTMRDYQPAPTSDGREYEHDHDFDRSGLLLEQAGMVRVGTIGNAVVRVFALRDLIHLLIDRYSVEPDIFYLDPARGQTELPDGCAVSTGDLRDGAGRLVETFWSCVDPDSIHR